MKKATIALLAMLCVVACHNKPAMAMKSVASANTLVDSRDGKTYKSVKIGEQIWMAENLNYDEKGSVCYNNKPDYCKEYGRLYNWEAASKACPKGWHLPSKAEYETLDSLVGDKEVIGKKLKAKDGWNQNNGTDEFGFTALPGGFGESDGKFFNARHYGNWWSATNYIETTYHVFDKNAKIRFNDAYFRSIYYNSELVSWIVKDKRNLYSVRCVKDLTAP